ncbi:bifunctional hydroxymethylpyrimidine kinase/phosphomethylpyrimidine kinase [Desulforhopalus singaporensis]|uniref:hydroxymethylpyrimidine kinase n=1 Tax=Desulforhopalus singaporensis TaxID=91360 RepID=A0A1H0UI63_9BACT|nr:bifunctional hydroxymethylpyrimidine kinase/phosphomethylpyrimidine kinase [Desulforhopalus singaporensis]SDP65851.1 hydroxymethylpyrimidine/phosphomethylpyrimidine kinase [Desulforhopalus singaporensis]
MNEKRKMRHYTRVVTIAGSDSGGGAGVQADLKTISACGCYAMSVITALTAQNTVGVSAIHPVPVDFVRQQIGAVMDDIGTDAVKLGMLYSSELIEAVSGQLSEYRMKNIVLDPVMVATSGEKLVRSEAVEALKRFLIPKADLITPNVPEAEVLLERKISTRDDLEHAAEQLSELGCDNVLIKGGHLADGSCSDLLYLGREKKSLWFDADRIATNNSHGTGCTLSSAIACGLAKGETLAEAVRLGKEYVTGAIAAGADYQIGSGHGPVNHFYRFFNS